MSVKDRIQDDAKTAMRARDEERLGAIRLILAAVKAARGGRTPRTRRCSSAQATLEKMIKQHAAVCGTPVPKAPAVGITAARNRRNQQRVIKSLAGATGQRRTSTPVAPAPLP